jgi:hypothetical protein
MHLHIYMGSHTYHMHTCAHVKLCMRTYPRARIPTVHILTSSTSTTIPYTTNQQQTCADGESVGTDLLGFSLRLRPPELFLHQVQHRLLDIATLNPTRAFMNVRFLVSASCLTAVEPWCASLQVGESPHYESEQVKQPLGQLQLQRGAT